MHELLKRFARNAIEQGLQRTRWTVVFSLHGLIVICVIDICLLPFWARSNWFQAVADTQPSTQFMSLYYVCMRVCVYFCTYSGDGKAIKLN